MSAFKDCEIVTARDPETGETVEAIRVPDGYVLCLITKETAERYADWTECAAVRITIREDGTGSFDITNDMDWVTSPEAEK